MPEKNLDVTNSQTWPDEIFDFSEKYEVGEFPGDFDIEPSDFHEFKRIIQGMRILARHATRLTEGEIQNIDLLGLNPLTEELVNKKISDAVRDNLLSTETARELLEGNVYKTESSAGRQNLICAVVDGRELPHSKSRLDHQLREWGGECIGNTSAGTKHRDILRSIGKPTVVSFWVDISHLSGSWHLENLLRQCICHSYGRDFVTGLHIEGLTVSRMDIEEIYHLEI